MKLSCTNVSKNYKDILAVDNVNLTFTPGIWGLLGPNGAGKTTLMRMLVGNLKTSNGEISYDKSNITKLKDSYKDKIGYLPQHFGYDKNQTVEGFLYYIAVLKGLNKNIIDNRISELLNQFNLINSRKKKVKNISGGMRRRVGICQAMLNNPEILIVDEPTAGLDIQERNKFRQYLTTISTDKIIILSTHIVSDIEFIANYLVFMNRGKIVEIGQSNSLIHRLDNTVFESVINQSQFSKIMNAYKIIDFRNESNGQVTIRYISENPLPNSRLVPPSLNDFYLSKVKEV